jgi:electron transfer flavoprotein alpha subunit
MVLVYITTQHGIAKSALETVSYARKLAEEVVVITCGSASAKELEMLGQYGAKSILVNRSIEGEDSQQLARLISSYALSLKAETVMFSHDFIGKGVAPRVSVRLKAGLVAGAISLPEADGSIKINVFSGKAIAFVKVNSPVKIISLLPNSVAPEITGANCAVEEISGDVGSAAIKVLSTKKPEGDIALPEAELVVSAGRGMKGPENWGMIEDLAKELGAATACSRPVADIGWRPHHEHVGQTGVAIRPNLYIAIGISGAIQHLAGVNGSKVIVVVNTDKEAPFFKAADYGVIGDAFDVIPRLTEAVRKFNAENN